MKNPKPEILTKDYIIKYILKGDKYDYNFMKRRNISVRDVYNVLNDVSELEMTCNIRNCNNIKEFINGKYNNTCSSKLCKFYSKFPIECLDDNFIRSLFDTKFNAPKAKKYGLDVQTAYLLLNPDSDKCEICNKKTRFINFSKGFRPRCKECQSDNILTPKFSTKRSLKYSLYLERNNIIELEYKGDHEIAKYKCLDCEVTFNSEPKILIRKIKTSLCKCKSYLLDKPNPSNDEIIYFIKTKLITKYDTVNSSFLKTGTWKYSREKELIDELLKKYNIDSILILLKILTKEIYPKKCKLDECNNMVYDIWKGDYNKFCSKSCSAKYTFRARHQTAQDNINAKINKALIAPKSNKSLAEIREIISNKNKENDISLLLYHGIYKNVIEAQIDSDVSLKETLLRIKLGLSEKPKCFCGNDCSISKYRKKYSKTCSRECQRIKINHIDKGVAPYSNILSDYEEYSKIVRNNTDKRAVSLPNYDLMGTCNTPGAFQLDHKFSILEGFNNNIPPWIIFNIVNLEMIPWKENTSKGTKCSISKDKLIDDFYEYCLI